MANAGRQIIESGPPMFKDLLKRPPVQQDQAKPVTRPWAVQKPVHQSQNARDDLDDDSDEEDDDTMLMGADRDDQFELKNARQKSNAKQDLNYLKQSLNAERNGGKWQDLELTDNADLVNEKQEELLSKHM